MRGEQRITIYGSATVVQFQDPESGDWVAICEPLGITT